MLGLSQALAAQGANISLPALRRIERGDSGVSLGRLRAHTLDANERREPVHESIGRIGSRGFIARSVLLQELIRATARWLTAWLVGVGPLLR
ncbi:helix-turn-helix transcriptional regulator [Specibacter sp. NPDC078692]|uniref:helix-turn-helix transcriptional regulator n=1 Tax=Specibacter sp. NPDC078692 TaxID=3155818 RepID=UPI00344AFA7E